MKMIGQLTLSLLCVGAIVNHANAENLNETMVEFLKAKVGVRVGGGECAHAASEALRVAGAAFEANDLGSDTPEPGDYVWGKLVKVLSVENDVLQDSAARDTIQPGDLLQYHDARFVTVTQTEQTISTATTVAAHHTSIVAKVNPARTLPVEVFEQNAPWHSETPQRKVVVNPIDCASLKAGWIRVYRPIQRKVRDGKYDFSLVNNVAKAQKVKLRIGGSTISELSLGPANTASSYVLPSLMTTSLTEPFLIVLENGDSLAVQDAKGYEITASEGEPRLQQLAR